MDIPRRNVRFAEDKIENPLATLMGALIDDRKPCCGTHCFLQLKTLQETAQTGPRGGYVQFVRPIRVARGTSKNVFKRTNILTRSVQTSERQE